MECESPRLSSGSANHQLVGSMHLQQRGSGVTALPAGSGINVSHPHHLHLIRSAGSSTSSSSVSIAPTRHIPTSHIVGSAVLDGGPVNMSSALSSRYVGESGSSYPSYLNMNLSNGPPPASSLDCTQTGSLNMPLVSGISATNPGGSLSSFNMNLNLAGHHVSLGGLNPSISSSSNSHHTQQSSGFPPPPSQFIGSMMPPYVGSNAVGVGLNTSSAGSGGGGSGSHHHHVGSSESGSSASSSDLGLNGANPKNNLLMSLSSRGGRQGPVNTNSSEDDRDQDESPMVCVQQSPVASH